MAVILSERAGTGREELIRPQPAQALPLCCRADRAARSIGQIALFGVFGVCGALMSALIVPAYSAFVRDRVRRARRTKCRAPHIAHLRRSMRALRLIDLEIVGLARVPAPGSLIVANHPSLIDALILLGHVKGAIVVAKRSLQINPFTSGAIRGAVSLSTPMRCRSLMSVVLASLRESRWFCFLSAPVLETMV